MQYHINISDNQYHDFRTAFTKAIRIAIENNFDEIVIAVNNIESLDSLIHPVLFGIASKLKRSGLTTIGDIKLYLETENDKSKFESGVIIASYVSEDYLQKILIDPRATDTIFVTNKPKELNYYLSKNKSKPLNNDL